MEKIKEVWSKLKYWQKGAFVGFFGGTAYYIYLLIESFKHRAPACSGFFSCVGISEYIVSFIPIVIVLSFYGILMSWFLKKLLIQKEKKRKKIIKYTIFFIVLIIGFIILYYIILRHITSYVLFLFNPPY